MTFKGLEDDIVDAPWKIFWRIFWAVVGIIAILSLTTFAFSYIGSAAKVAQQEFSAEAMLKKYEWFKDASAQLDAKRADISIYERRLREPVINDRLDREQRNMWITEQAGVTASYNALAADYNAQMAKFNWSFANAGTLPAGAAMPLPREYKPYAMQ